jgi:tetratricopeptide (TPR) repeat protein
MQDGNVTRAKQVLQLAGSTLDPGRILASTGVSRDYSLLVRVFAADYGDAIIRLTVQAVGDSAGYYLSKAQFYGVKNDTLAARAYCDSARVVLEAKLAARPAHEAAAQWPVELSLALAYAGLGRKAAALQFGREGTRLVPVSRDAFAGPLVLLGLAQIYMRTGEYDAALDQLEYLVSIPSPVSIALLRVDPLYTPLRGNLRFERLVRGKS